MELTKEILEILKNNRSWELEEFLRYFKVSEEELYIIFLNIIEKEIEKLDFDADVDEYKYLYKIFKYFDNLDSVKLIKQVSKNLKKVKSNLEQTLDRTTKKGNEKGNSNNIFYKLLDIIDVTLLKLKFDQDFNLKKETDQNAYNYQFLHELIYNVKNYDYVYEVFKTSHQLMYVTNSQGQSLIDELLDYYIQIVKNNDNHYDIIYFEKIIKLFLNSKYFVIEKDYLTKLINKLLTSIDSIKNQKIKKQEMIRIKFFLNEVIQDFKKNNTKNDADELNYKFNILETFPDDVLIEECSCIMIDDKKYSDLRNKFTITIDSPGTKMYDDACSFEKLKNGVYLLGIYVTDANAFLKRDSQLEQLAQKKAETIYLPGHQVTMFPYEFTSQLSLNKDTNRHVVAHLFTFDPQMNLIGFYARRAIINVNHNLNYHDITKILQTSNDPQLFNTIKNMIEATEKLKEKPVYNEQYEVIKKIKRKIINKKESSEFRYGESSIFSTFIVLMNHYVANYFNDHPDIPFPFYVNLSKYDDYMIKNLKDKIYNNDDFESILDCLNEIYVPSFYSTKNLGHNGLNLKSYANASNPLRQYISLLTERLVKHHMIDNSQDLLFDLNQMEQICEYINNRQKLNFEYSHEYIKTLKKRKY